MASNATVEQDSTVEPETTKEGTKSMTASHKQALAEGREHGRIIKSYLDALSQSKPKRGRKVNPDVIQERLEKIDADLHTVSSIDQLRLIQEKMNLTDQLAQTQEVTNFDEIEKDFIRVAKPYAERRSFSYQAFREVGVPASVLKAAGLEK